MNKQRVIFSDVDKAKKEEAQLDSAKREEIYLSREEYRELIKDAYQEGREEALDEKEKHTEQMLQSASPGNNLPGKGPDTVAKPQERKRRLSTKTAVPESEKDTLEVQGKEEAMRTHAKEEQENLQRFKSITKRHEIEIMRAKSVWPFSLFTDTLVIDTTKVTVAHKQMFATEYVATIPLKDLADVNIQTVLFLGTVLIKYMPQSESPGMTQPVEVRIPNLTRENAVKAKNILKGALVSKAEEIDIAKLPPDEVVKVLEKFGGNEGVV